MYIGIDAHKRMCEVGAISQDKKVLFQEQCRTSKKGLNEFAMRIPKGAKVAVEASTSGKFVARVLMEAGVDVTVGHPAEIRRRMGNTKKTDTLDCMFIAEMLRMDWLPKAYLPSKEDDELRGMLRHRLAMGKRSRTIKNQIHAMLQGQGIQLPFADIFGKGGSEYLDRLPLPASSQFMLEQLLEQLDLSVRQQRQIEDILALRASGHEACKRLMTLPGVDYYSGLLILMEIGDVTRFPDAKHLCSYAGLVPRVSQSGDHMHRGGIHKQGPGALRWIMVVCAHAAVKARNSRWHREYQRLSRRIGAKKAIVAIARKMLTVVFALLVKNEDYVEKDPKMYQRKILRMKWRAREIPVSDVSGRVDRLSPEALERLISEEDGYAVPR